MIEAVILVLPPKGQPLRFGHRRIGGLRMNAVVLVAAHEHRAPVEPELVPLPLPEPLQRLNLDATAESLERSKYS